METDTFPRLSWNDELRIKAVFRDRTWHSACLARNPLMPGSLCHHEGSDGRGCIAVATSRILVNIWGTVAEYEVCDEHTWYHGKLLDDFPLRKAVS